ncbi:hypothetical protein PGTUg99_027924 [Puccinia graminis f. sp. tritici]|uniref:Uncharacterized protein n=1 Tax=Puccinia graminis f. sp. tritici TaxID=56615 RepID=A0A5B0SMC8_PUCGR|nr:hypothetical protein PGTUg99_027924 [Puccinia graminis f. sp. tritici]
MSKVPPEARPRVGRREAKALHRAPESSPPNQPIERPAAPTKHATVGASYVFSISSGLDREYKNVHAAEGFVFPSGSARDSSVCRFDDLGSLPYSPGGRVVSAEMVRQ